MKEKVLFSWSSGKDSGLALYAGGTAMSNSCPNCLPRSIRAVKTANSIPLSMTGRSLKPR